MIIGRWNRAAFAALLGGALVATAVASPARAQWFFGPPVLPERAVVSVLRQDGFRRISPPVLNHDVYVLNAIDPEGEAVRVIIDAYSGHILQAHLRRNAPWVLADPYEGDPLPPARVQPRPQKQAVAPPPRTREPAVVPERATPVPEQRRQPLTRQKETPARPAERPPVAAVPPGSKAEPRVIPISPVVPLDDVPARTVPPPAPGQPTPYMPPAPLE